MWPTGVMDIALAYEAKGSRFESAVGLNKNGNPVFHFFEIGLERNQQKALVVQMVRRMALSLIH
jgi:hypothetical protein